VCIVDAGAKSSTISIVDRNAVKESYTFSAEQKPLAELIGAEIQQVDDKFFNQEHKHVEEVYLTGGNVHTPGLTDAVAQYVRKPVTIKNCFLSISSPSGYARTLADMSPSFAGAVGAAMN